LKAARKALDDGFLVCIFAEGGLTLSGLMRPFKPGFERIIKGSDHPIIPVYIGGAWGSYSSWKNGRASRAMKKKMKKILVVLIMCLTPFILSGQDPNGNFNPFVDGGNISPAPLLPIESGGKGSLSFNLGNSGEDPLEVYPEHYMILTISLSHGIPDNEDPILAIGGSLAGGFSWKYDVETRTYSGIQLSEIPAQSSGSIEINFKVDKNSASPGANGFNVNITPAPYQTASNDQGDDAVSSYTYTDESSAIALNSEPSLSLYPNPTTGKFYIDFKEDPGRLNLEIVAADGRIVKKDVIQPLKEPWPVDMAGSVPGHYIIRLYNEERSYRGDFIIE
jgi:hypothetical protein